MQIDIPRVKNQHLWDGSWLRASAFGGIADLAALAAGSIRSRMPDKPSIAVLPFQNISDDPEQEYFADGIPEDLLTALSRIRWLFVIARNSTFVFKGKAVEVKEVGKLLSLQVRVG